MQKPSFMPINLLVPLLMQLGQDHNMEGFKKAYEEIMREGAAAGFEAVDITSSEIGVLGINAVLNVLKKTGLNAASLIYSDMLLTEDDNASRKCIERAGEAIRTAKMIGCSAVMLAPQHVQEYIGHSADEIHSIFAHVWTSITDLAGEEGIICGIEHNPDLSLRLCKGDDLADMFERVPNLKLFFDTANVLLPGENQLDHIVRFEERIGYIHLKDYQRSAVDTLYCERTQDGIAMEIAPTGKGCVPFGKILKKLKENNYEGGMTIEFCPDPDSNLRNSLQNDREYILHLL